MTGDRCASAEPIVEVVDVRNTASSAPELIGACLDLPGPRATASTYAVRVAGWVLARSEPVREIELSVAGNALRRTPVTLPRPDVAQVHPDAAQAGDCGFDTELGLIGLPRECRVAVDGILSGERRVPLGELDLRRRPLDCGFRPRLQPLMVTSLFRMGTTRMMRLLAEHPAVVVQRTYPYETRVASYWLHALRVLSQPANLHQSSEPTELLGETAWIGHNPFYRPPITDQPELEQCLGRDGVEELAAFCLRAGEQFYLRAAAAQGRPGALYFAEKHVPDSYAPLLLHELFPRAREIVLVRDFRDVVCSILAFNRKRGYPSFGRQKVGSDAEMIELLGERAGRLADAWRERSDRALLVRYEELVRAPVATLRRVFEHLEIDADAAAIDAVMRAADRDTPELEFHRTTRSPRRSVGRWQRELEPEEIHRCERHLGEALEAFGYGTAGAPEAVRS